MTLGMSVIEVRSLVVDDKLMGQKRGELGNCAGLTFLVNHFGEMSHFVAPWVRQFAGISRILVNN